MHISDLLMPRKPELVRRRPAEGRGVGKAMPREMVWCAESSSPMATSTTIQNQAPEGGSSFR